MLALRILRSCKLYTPTLSSIRLYLPLQHSITRTLTARMASSSPPVSPVVTEQPAAEHSPEVARGTEDQTMDANPAAEHSLEAARGTEDQTMDANPAAEHNPEAARGTEDQTAGANPAAEHSLEAARGTEDQTSGANPAAEHSLEAARGTEDQTTGANSASTSAVAAPVDTPKEDSSREEGDCTVRDAGAAKEGDKAADAPSSEDRSTTPPVEDTTAPHKATAEPVASKPAPQTTDSKEQDKQPSKATDTKEKPSHKSNFKDKPWPFNRSSTSPIENREYFEKLTLSEKRKLYRCGKHFVRLQDILTWPDFSAANKCSSRRNLTNPFLEDAAINSKVSLWRGDMTKLEIDAIVNAANKTLLGGGGVDGAIHDAAGSSLRRECYTLDGCNTGAAKLTGGHRLPAKYIIHTVGPMGERRGDLISCYEECLRLVEQHGLKTIAFCCISTGIYGYPNQGAAVQALKTVRQWFETNEYARTKMERVIFCVFLKIDYEIYSELMCLFFPTTPATTATPAAEQKQERAEKKDTPSDSGQTPEASSTPADTAAAPVSGDTTERGEKESTPPVQEASSPPAQSQAPTGVPTLTSAMTAPAAIVSEHTAQDTVRQEDQSAKSDTVSVNESEPKTKLPKLEGECGSDTQSGEAEKGAEKMDDKSTQNSSPEPSDEGKEDSRD